MGNICIVEEALLPLVKQFWDELQAFFGMTTGNLTRATQFSAIMRSYYLHLKLEGILVIRTMKSLVLKWVHLMAPVGIFGRVFSC